MNGRYVTSPIHKSDLDTSSVRPCSKTVYG